MVKDKKSHDISKTVWTTLYFFPHKMFSQNHFYQIGNFKKISLWRQNVANICHFFRCIVATTVAYTKGDYVGNPTGESQENDCKTRELEVFLQLMPDHIATFVKTLGSH